MTKIVNVHIPKCAGTSFRETLVASFRMKLDYGSRISRPEHEVIADSIAFNDQVRLPDYATVDCVYGHFIPLKYLSLYQAGWKFITWVREPAQRLIAHYYHYQRQKEKLMLDENEGSPGNYVVKQGLTLEEFVVDPLFMNSYRRFFYRFPPELYYFIGVVENFTTDLACLSQRLNLKLNDQNENRNPTKTGASYQIEPDLFRLIQTTHAEDYALYLDLLATSNKRR